MMYESSYLSLLSDILYVGETNKTGAVDSQGNFVSAKTLFNCDIPVDRDPSCGGIRLALMTHRRMYINTVVAELNWMLSGNTNTKYLNDRGVHIWDKWADENGDLGPIYGEQWRNWPPSVGDENSRHMFGFDQIAKIDDTLRDLRKGVVTRDSRRMVLSAWNVSQLDSMKLAPCHLLSCFQYMQKSNTLNLSVIMRSCDVPVGLPYNIAFYHLFLIKACRIHDMNVGDMSIHLVDAHIYENQIASAKHIINCKEFYPRVSPRIIFDGPCKMERLSDPMDEFYLDEYNCGPVVKFEVAK